MEKILAILIAVSMILAFAACGKNGNEGETSTVVAEYGNDETATNSEKNDEPQSSAVDTTGISESSTTAAEISTASGDPSAWTNEEIVAFYKAAAAKSSGVKSKQVMSLSEMSVNDGDGILGVAVKIGKPLITAALEKNSTELDGITGGHQNLEVTDAKSMRAYKSGNYTIIEMAMKEQTDGIYADTFSGTVGHAISVVGNIAVVQESFPNIEIHFDKSDIKLKYTNPVLKVKINQNGIIEKGTWSYTVDITVKHLQIEKNIMINNAHGKVGYVITTGGGF